MSNARAARLLSASAPPVRACGPSGLCCRYVRYQNEQEPPHSKGCSSHSTSIPKIESRTFRRAFAKWLLVVVNDDAWQPCIAIESVGISNEGPPDFQGLI